jgi:hypothetical protein
MSHLSLDADLAAALQVLEHALGPLQALELHPNMPPRRPNTPPAPAAASTQPCLLELPAAPPPTPTRSGGTADELV